MFGWGKKKKSDNLFDLFANNLERSKLRLSILKLRLVEYSLIEDLGRAYLKTVAKIEYDSIEDANWWVIMVGALFAIEIAQKTKSMMGVEDSSKGFKEHFEGFLKTTIWPKDYDGIRQTITRFISGKEAHLLQDLMMEKLGATDYDSRIKTLATAVATLIGNEGSIYAISDALYGFYFRARNNYFLGEAITNSGADSVMGTQQKRQHKFKQPEVYF